MKPKSLFTQPLRLFSALCLLLILLLPLIFAAFPQAWGAAPNPADRVTTVRAAPTGESPYFTLDQGLQEDTPINKPIYDAYTLQERVRQHLPVGLPPFEYVYTEKVVYLTFDDGPNPKVTPVILDILRKNNIHATFFVIGTQVEKYPDLLKQIIQEGHALGNHSYSHVYRQLYQSEWTYLAELERNEQIIKNILGVRPIITRAPGGSTSFTANYWELLRQKGYVNIDWNMDSGDAKGAGAKQMVQLVEQQLKKAYLWNHAILLMHDGINHQETAKALPEIIHLFRQKGFEFRCITPSTPPAW